MSYDRQPNVAALELLLLWAEKEWVKKQAGKPSEWNQRSWVNAVNFKTVDGTSIDFTNDLQEGTFCGTACCIAGKAVALAGGRYEVMEERYPDDSFYVPGTYRSQQLTERVFMPGEVDAKPISDAAVEFLGLTDRERNLLFSGSNGIEEVREAIADIIERAAKSNSTIKARV